MKQLTLLALSLSLAAGATAMSAPARPAAPAAKPAPVRAQQLPAADFYLALVASNIDPDFEGFLEMEVFPDSISSRGFDGILTFDESDFPIRARTSRGKVSITGAANGIRFTATLAMSASRETMSGTYRLAGAINDQGTFTASTLLYTDDLRAAKTGQGRKLLSLRRR